MRIINLLIAKLRGAVDAGGARESGLASLIWVCAINACGDTFVAIALADTVFFAVPAGQARGRVALYLITTMAPFALLAPVVGPILDKFRHGRRYALAFTFFARGFLAVVLARHDKGLTIYPVALGVLIGSRAFSLAKSSAMPRVLPHGLTLVQANARLAITGVATAAVIAPLALGIEKGVGHNAVLVMSSFIFIVGIVLSIRLPSHVDHTQGETDVAGIRLTTAVGLTELGGTPLALRSQVVLRGLVGFLTLFIAFQLRKHGGNLAALGALAAAASLGQAAGVGIGGLMRRRRPEALLTLALTLSVVACILGALRYAVPIAILVALVVSLSASLGKLGLDSVIQRDVAASAQASAFGKSETSLQLGWVAGGGLGLIPWSGTLGFALCAITVSFALMSRLQSQQLKPRPPRPR